MPWHRARTQGAESLEDTGGHGNIRTPPTCVYRNLRKGCELPRMMKLVSSQLHLNISVARIVIQLLYYVFLGLLLYILRYCSLMGFLPNTHLMCVQRIQNRSQVKEGCVSRKNQMAKLAEQQSYSTAWQKRHLCFYAFCHLVIKY